MNLRTLATWAAVVFAIWFIIMQPVAAGHLVHNISHLLAQAAAGFATFIKGIL